jgi:hypothetical protein
MMMLLIREVFIKPARLLLWKLTGLVVAAVGWLIFGSILSGILFVLLVCCGVSYKASASVAAVVAIPGGALWLMLIGTYPRYDNLRSRPLSKIKRES